MKTVGIIGFGAMGKSIASSMCGGMKVMAYDPDVAIGTDIAREFNEVVAADIVIIAVPAKSMKTYYSVFQA